MAKATKTKKSSSKKSENKKADAPKNPDAPKIIVAKGGLTKAKLLERVLATMEEENWITKKQGKDFVESLQAVVVEEISEGRPVNVFDLVKITPRLHTSGKRTVRSDFNDPESKLVTKKYPSKVTFKVGQGIFPKLIKEALPTAQKLAKVIGK